MLIGVTIGCYFVIRHCDCVPPPCFANAESDAVTERESSPSAEYPLSSPSLSSAGKSFWQSVVCQNFPLEFAILIVPSLNVLIAPEQFVLRLLDRRRLFVVLVRYRGGIVRVFRVFRRGHRLRLRSFVAFFFIIFLVALVRRGAQRRGHEVERELAPLFPSSFGLVVVVVVVVERACYLDPTP